MEKKFDIIRAKKFAEDLKSGKDILNIKKNKFLSLRKKNNNKNNYNRILKGKGIEENKKYSLYEFDENDFKNGKINFVNVNDVYKLPFEKNKNNFYDNEEFKYWLYLVYKRTIEGDKTELKNILKNFTKEKIEFLINILIDSSQFNNSSNNIFQFEEIKNNIKFKYNICSILINLLYDTEEYNEIFIENIMSIYNFISILIKLYKTWNEISFIVLIIHYQWLINNLIIESNIYSEIIEKNPKINFPELIQDIFNLNKIELYLVNIRMLILFLDNQENPQSFIQYKIFISILDKIITNCSDISHIDILLASYKALNKLFKSEANCVLVLEDKNYIKLINKIIQGFNSFTFCDCCLTKLIKNDKENVINETYQIHLMLIDIIFKKIPATKNIIKHALKIMRLIFYNKNGFNVINYLINTYTKNIFAQLQLLFSEKPNNLLIQSEVFNFLFAIFDLSNNSFKAILISNGLDKFNINCLEECYQEFISENKDNTYYNKLIVQMLNLLYSILKFGESDLNMKITLKEYCEEKNIYQILNELNYSKNKLIQDLVENINTDYFEGYENEELNEDEENEDKLFLLF